MKTPLWLDTFLCTLFTAMVGAFFYLVFFSISFLNPLTQAFSDFELTDIYYSELFKPQKASPKVILVNVARADRKQLAEIIQKIQQQEPRVIGLDMIFKELKEPQSDSLLRESLQADNIVTSSLYKSKEDSTEKNHVFFRRASVSEGFINVLAHENHYTVRDFDAWLLASDHADTLKSFAAQIALKYNPSLSPKIKTLSSSVPIDFTGNLQQFTHFEYAEIMDRDSLPVIKDAIVLLGHIGAPLNNPYDIEDKHFTPLNERISGKSVPDMYGVVIQANIVQALIDHSYITKIGKFWVWLFGLVAGICCIFYGLRYQEKEPEKFELLNKAFQFLLSVSIVYLSFLLLNFGVVLPVTLALIFPILSLEMINIYLSLKYLIKRKVVNV